MNYTFDPKGVCSKKMNFALENGIITDLTIEKGCDGNLQGIAKLAVNRPATEVIQLLEGIKCGPRETSCPDQLARALKKALG